jgi:hypothetical protein
VSRQPGMRGRACGIGVASAAALVLLVDSRESTGVVAGQDMASAPLQIRIERVGWTDVQLEWRNMLGHPVDLAEARHHCPAVEVCLEEGPVAPGEQVHLRFRDYVFWSDVDEGYVELYDRHGASVGTVWYCVYGPPRAYPVVAPTQVLLPSAVGGQFRVDVLLSASLPRGEPVVWELADGVALDRQEQRRQLESGEWIQSVWFTGHEGWSGQRRIAASVRSTPEGEWNRTEVVVERY